jgi:hypothetical protein
MGRPSPHLLGGVGQQAGETPPAKKAAAGGEGGGLDSQHGRHAVRWAGCRTALLCQWVCLRKELTTNLFRCCVSVGLCETLRVPRTPCIGLLGSVSAAHKAANECLKGAASGRFEVSRCQRRGFGTNEDPTTKPGNEPHCIP